MVFLTPTSKARIAHVCVCVRVRAGKAVQFPGTLTSSERLRVCCDCTEVFALGVLRSMPD